MDASNKDTLRSQQNPSPGRATTDSSHFRGHEARMAALTERVWNHACERTDGKRCRDCIYRRKR
jgi:hypothetical protein